MKPFIVNTCELMLKARIITLKDASEKTVQKLQELGVLHIETAHEPTPLDKAGIEARKNSIQQTADQLRSLLGHLSGERTVTLPEWPEPYSIPDITKQASELCRSGGQILHKIERLQEKIRSHDLLRNYLQPLASVLSIPVRELQYQGKYLFSDVAVFSEEVHALFMEKASSCIIQEVSVPHEGKIITYVLATAQARPRIEALLRQYEELQLHVPDSSAVLQDYLQTASRNILEQKEQLAVLHKRLQDMVEKNIEDIVLFGEILNTENERLTALEQASAARYVSIIEGWIPAKNADAVSMALSTAKPAIFMDLREPLPDETPPTKLHNPPLIRPFQVIVSLFSLPRYGDWDPTPLVAYFFAFFFGIMLNDLVYAAGLILFARFFLNKFTDDPSTEAFLLFRNVLYISGTVSLLMGLLTGTYLGDFLSRYFQISPSSLTPFKAIQEGLADPVTFIIFSLIIGLVHINIAHLLAFLRGLQERHPGVVINKAGLLCTEICGIPYILYQLFGVHILPFGTEVYVALPYVLAIGLFAVISGEIIHIGSLGGILWIFDLTGLLGDIMSYSRLAGVGLATFYLASSFNLLADWVSSTLTGLIPGSAGIVLAFLAALIILVSFHIFNLLLSSLAAFIHSIRLCFVEFLLKFYEGGGKPYAPLQAKHRKIITVGNQLSYDR